MMCAWDVCVIAPMYRCCNVGITTSGQNSQTMFIDVWMYECIYIYTSDVYIYDRATTCTNRGACWWWWWVWTHIKKWYEWVWYNQDVIKKWSSMNAMLSRNDEEIRRWNSAFVNQFQLRMVTSYAEPSPFILAFDCRIRSIFDRYSVDIRSIFSWSSDIQLIDIQLIVCYVVWPDRAMGRSKMACYARDRHSATHCVRENTSRKTRKYIA